MAKREIKWRLFFAEDASGKEHTIEAFKDADTQQAIFRTKEKVKFRTEDGTELERGYWIRYMGNPKYTIVFRREEHGPEADSPYFDADNIELTSDGSEPF